MRLTKPQKLLNAVVKTNAFEKLPSIPSIQLSHDLKLPWLLEKLLLKIDFQSLLVPGSVLFGICGQVLAVLGIK